MRVILMGQVNNWYTLFSKLFSYLRWSFLCIIFTFSQAEIKFSYQFINQIEYNTFLCSLFNFSPFLCQLPLAQEQRRRKHQISLFCYLQTRLITKKVHLLPTTAAKNVCTMYIKLVYKVMIYTLILYRRCKFFWLKIAPCSCYVCIIQKFNVIQSTSMQMIHIYTHKHTQCQKYFGTIFMFFICTKVAVGCCFCGHCNSCCKGDKVVLFFPCSC